MATKGEQTRDTILEGALKLASRVGLEGLTIGTLSEELSLSKSGLFAHFGSKEALLLRHARVRRGAVRRGDREARARGAAR